MKLSGQINAARASGFWIAIAVAVLIICLGFITFSGGSRDSMKIAVICLSGSLVCMIASALYSRRDIRAAAARARGLEDQAKSARTGETK